MVTILNDKVVCFAKLKKVIYVIFIASICIEYLFDRFTAQRFILIFNVLIHVSLPKGCQFILVIDNPKSLLIFAHK